MPKHTFKPLAAVIGHPVSHSLSPAIFRTLGVTSYDALDILPEELVAFTNRLRTEDWVGCNVTLPHKQNVIPC
ncbi:MAG TPA: shikimate dehydrogenase, partial [Bdellovibrionales bacterium]|nr:shikimate dehydrogenase [Bdellovibrionales bacterium]